MSRIQEQISNIYEQIADLRADSQRSIDPMIIAASKARSVAEIEEAYSAGIRNFGENYLQEALNKIEALNDKDLNWHFIGPIQSNKCKPIAEHFHWVHSVDRLKVANKLNQYAKAANKNLNICLQVNIDNEANKAGLAAQELKPLISEIKNLSNISIRGLMVIPKKRLNPSEQRQCFAEIKALFDDLKNTCGLTAFDSLSMGMSEDFHSALLEGANMVRLGTIIFGPRTKD